MNANKRPSISKNIYKRIIRWIPPTEGCCKINFDGSVKDSMAAADFVLRYDCGVPVVAGATRLGSTSINVAECLALRDAL